MSSESTIDWVAGFQASREAGREGQSYLLEGDARGASLETAIGLLQAVMCRDAERAPCGQCPACRAVRERRHADVQWIEPAGAGRFILIEAVRERALVPLSKTSYSGGWKGVVLLQADRLNTSAANALLKALEEPPAQTLIILVSDAVSDIPDTVVSRCRRLRVPGGSDLVNADDREQTLTLLAGLPPRPGALECLAAGATFARIIAERTEAIEKEQKTAAPDEDETIRTARIRTQTLETTRELLRFLEEWQRALLLVTLGAADALPAAFAECRDAIERQAGALDPAAAMRRIQAVEKAQRRLDLHLSPDSVIEACFQAVGRDTAGVRTPPR